jgi:hypothetical protein
VTKKANGPVKEKVAASTALKKVQPVEIDEEQLIADEARLQAEHDPVDEKPPAPKPNGPYVPDAKKTNFKKVDGDDAFPFHDKHDLTPREAAEALARLQGDKPWITEGWVSGVERRIAAKHAIADAIAAATKLNRSKVLSQLLTVDSVAKAEAYRTHLLTQIKAAKTKAALLTAFSNEAIAGVWKRSRKK